MDSASTKRPLSWVTKAGDGSIGPSVRRRVSRGSVIAVAPLIGLAIGPSGSDQEGLGGVHCALEDRGDLRDTEPVEIAERQRRLVMWSQFSQHHVGAGRIEFNAPRIIDRLHPVGDKYQHALLAFLSPPVVDEFVTGHPDQPWDTQFGLDLVVNHRDSGQEGFGDEILSRGRVAAPAQQIAMTWDKPRS